MRGVEAVFVQQPGFVLDFADRTAGDATQHGT
jgi:hypothetical protein